MKEIKIKDIVGKKRDYDFYILAETAFSHEGKSEYLRKQIDLAKKGKVNGIKFQIIIDYENTYVKNYPNYDKIKKLCFEPEEWKDLIKIAKSLNLDVVVLPIDMKSIEFIRKNLEFIDALEIHSICFNEVPFIREISRINKPKILGIGGRTFDDITFLLKILKNYDPDSSDDYIMMYGFQNFPTDFTKLNLSKLRRINEEFQQIIGYADHTKFDNYKFGNELIKYSFLYGARIFEKHLVLKRGENRIDYESAVSYKELIELREELNEFIEILGNEDISKLNDVELMYKEREKSLIAVRNLEKGSILTKEDIGYKVTTQKSDFQQKDFENLINKKLTQAIKRDEVFKFIHIS